MVPLNKTAQEGKVYCSNCRHHSTFHQLVTRDKWSELYGPNERPSISHKIPWFCEYMVTNPLRESEDICGCENLNPATFDEVFGRKA